MKPGRQSHLLGEMVKVYSHREISDWILQVYMIYSNDITVYKNPSDLFVITNRGAAWHLPMAPPKYI